MRRLSALFVMAAMLAAGLAVWHPGHAAGAGSCGGAPSVTGVSPQVAAAGASVTVTGSGFQQLLCSGSSLTVTAGNVSTTVSPNAVANNGNTQSFAFTAQPGMDGGVAVSTSGLLGATPTSNNNLAFYTPPSITGVAPSAPKVGDAVTVSGHGFSFMVPSGDEHLAASYPGGCAAPGASLTSDSTISLSPPESFCTGAVGLTITAPRDLNNATNTQIPVYSDHPGNIDVQSSGVGLASGSATAGGPVTINGAGLGTGGSATIGGAPAGVASWADTAVTLTVPDTAVSNSPVVLTRGGDNATIPAGSLGVVAHMDSLTPSTASAGDTVTINGGGFGFNAGSVTLGSTSIPVASWSPTAIAVKIPTGSQSGSIAVLPKDTSPPASTLALKVNVPPINIGPGPSGQSGSSNAAGSSAKPLTPDQVQQVASALSAPPAALPAPQVGGPLPTLPPSHPTNGPVAMSLKTNASTALPGKTVPFTVTLTAYGQPVANAAVQMVIAYEPASDGTVTPSSGITDAKGQFKGTVHLSKTPGEMIILARAGEFSDEVRLVGSTTATTAHLSGGSAPLLNLIPIGIVVLASLLVLTGIGIRLWLAFGGNDRISTALFFERLRQSGAGERLRTRLGSERPSGNADHAGGDAPAEVEAPGQPQTAVVLHAVDGDAAPDESKERIEVHS